MSFFVCVWRERHVGVEGWGCQEVAGEGGGDRARGLLMRFL